jgi:threonine dehydratase
VLVSDDEMRAAQVLMIEETSHLVETAGVAPLAAALRLRKQFASKRITLIASGGNPSRDRILGLLK